jgi:hypothetical protein
VLGTKISDSVCGAGSASGQGSAFADELELRLGLRLELRLALAVLISICSKDDWIQRPERILLRRAYIRKEPNTEKIMGSKSPKCCLT